MTLWNRSLKVALAAAAVVAWMPVARAAEYGSSTDQGQSDTSSVSQESPPAAEAPQAAESSTPEAAPTPAATRTAPDAPPGPAVVNATSSAPGLISVDFKDADIRQVLRIISLKAGVDIVAGADVEGLVTIKLTNVPWEEALDIILRTYGFTYERKGQIVRVLTKEALESEVLSTEVFPLNYATAKDVPAIIQEMVSDRGKVRFDERTNTVIVTDIPSSLYQIKAVIERIDQRTPQVLVESKIIDTQLSKEENLGIEWTQSFSLTQTVPTLSSTFPFPSHFGFGKLGKTFAISRTGATSRATIAVGTLDASDLALTLNMLRNRTETNIVSNPSIAIIDNKKATIHIGQDYPVPNYTIDPTTGNVQINGYQSKQTGTLLEVTPHINPAKEIVVELKPEIIAVGDPISYSTGNQSVQLPLFTTQTAQTTVRITSGQTIALGGLVKTSDSHVQKTVPFLGEIPVVGLLFRNNRWYSGGSSPNRQDLLIFLTVKLMEDVEPAPTMVAEPVAASPSDAGTPYSIPTSSSAAPTSTTATTGPVTTTTATP